MINHRVRINAFWARYGWSENTVDIPLKTAPRRKSHRCNNRVFRLTIWSYYEKFTFHKYLHGLGVHVESPKMLRWTFSPKFFP